MYYLNLFDIYNLFTFKKFWLQEIKKIKNTLNFFAFFQIFPFFFRNKSFFSKKKKKNNQCMQLFKRKALEIYAEDMRLQCFFITKNLMSKKVFTKNLSEKLSL